MGKAPDKLKLRYDVFWALCVGKQIAKTVMSLIALLPSSNEAAPLGFRIKNIYSIRPSEPPLEKFNITKIKLAKTPKGLIKYQMMQHP